MSAPEPMISPEAMRPMLHLLRGRAEPSPQQMYESALAAHARYIKDEAYLLRGVELGLIIGVTDGRGNWRYTPNPEHPAWLDEDEYELDEDEE